MAADINGLPPWDGLTCLSGAAPGGFLRHHHLGALPLARPRIERRLSPGRLLQRRPEGSTLPPDPRRPRPPAPRPPATLIIRGMGPESPWPDEVFATPAAPLDAALQSRTGGRIDLDPQRWHDAPGPADMALLARTRGPVLDIGCGPGRLVHALVVAGRVALGIDVSAAAVASTRLRGAPAVHTSVFGPVPSAGQWGTALLLDGNIGIGGDAARLLRHTAGLIAPEGLILVEVDSPSSVSEDVEVRVDLGGRVGSWFPWSRIAVGDLPALACAAGLALDEVWQHSGRWFAALASDLASEAEAAS